MSENNGNGKKMALIRSVICLAVILIITLGRFKIIPTTISLIAACILLTIIAVWNGASLFKSGKKSMAVFNIIIGAVIILLCAAFIISEIKQ
ncbi:MAG: hypothetical protein ACI4I9_08475 [Porcipelethomonas sp.]